jgi:hypothetical protein
MSGWMIALPRPLRAATLFLGNLFAAVVGTTMIDTGITSGILGWATLSTMRGHCLAEDLLSAMVASALGYFAYYKLKSDSAMWVWVVGLCWFGQQVLRNLTEIDRMYFIESSYPDVTPTMKMFDTWVSYTPPFVRTVFYSAGAFSCFLRSPLPNPDRQGGDVSPNC